MKIIIQKKDIYYPDWMIKEFGLTEPSGAFDVVEYCKRLDCDLGRYIRYTPKIQTDEVIDFYLKSKPETIYIMFLMEDVPKSRTQKTLNAFFDSDPGDIAVWKILEKGYFTNYPERADSYIKSYQKIKEVKQKRCKNCGNK